MSVLVERVDRLQVKVTQLDPKEEEGNGVERSPCRPSVVKILIESAWLVHGHKMSMTLQWVLEHLLLD